MCVRSVIVGHLSQLSSHLLSLKLQFLLKCPKTYVLPKPILCSVIEKSCNHMNSAPFLSKSSASHRDVCCKGHSVWKLWRGTLTHHLSAVAEPPPSGTDLVCTYPTAAADTVSFAGHCCCLFHWQGLPFLQRGVSQRASVALVEEGKKSH